MNCLKYISGLLLFVCCVGFVYGQNVVTGKYKGHVVKMKYYKGSPDDIQYLEYGLVNELNKTVSRLENEKASLQKELNKLKGKATVSSDDSLQLQLIIQERDLLARERTIDSLNERVVVLSDSLQQLQNVVNTPVTPTDKNIRSSSADCSHFGVSYSMGIPLLFSSALNHKDDMNQPLWNRRMTLSHQIGLYWGSRSLVRKGSLSLGVGLEYSRMRFVAAMTTFSDTLDAVDEDNDTYTAYLTYRNVEESATLHYLSIPLTLSIGQPYHDRISGYFQLSLVPSFCLSSSYKTSGFYDLAGYYSQYDLTLDNFDALGFGTYSVGELDEDWNANRFVLTGRVAGGIYLPMCRTQQGKTSPWVMKLGIKLDFSITPMAKGNQTDGLFKAATAYSSDGCRFLDPALEVGIMYIFGTKNKQ